MVDTSVDETERSFWHDDPQDRAPMPEAIDTIKDLKQRLSTVEAECDIYYEIAAAAIGEEQTIALRDAAMRRRSENMVQIDEESKFENKDLTKDEIITAYHYSLKACYEEMKITDEKVEQLQAERDQAIKEIERIGRELGTTQAERDELQRRCESYKAAYDAILADLQIMEQKLNDLQVENSRLIRIGEERHIRAKDTEEGLMEHVERLQAENERLLRCLADYPAGNQTEPDVKAANGEEVDGELSKKT